MAEGQVYVEVDASVVNGGIAPMAMVSGNPEPVDGQAYVVVWIRWKYDSETGAGGYTGTGWHFDDPNNGLQGYGSEEDFKKYLVESGITSFDNILSDWEPAKKAAFLNAHLGVLEANDCVYFTANSTNSNS